MADIFNRLFGRFSFTDLETKNVERHPLIVRKSLNKTFEMLQEYIEKKENVQNKIFDLDYLQLYFTEKRYEVTLLLLADSDGKTIVSCHVACSIPGKSLKYLYKIMHEVKEVLNNDK